MTTNFVSTFFAICNAIGMLPGSFVPYLVGVILDSGDNLMTQWSIAFYFAAACTLIAMIIIVLFVKCEIEPWDKIETEVEQEVEIATVSVKVEVDDCEPILID